MPACRNAESAQRRRMAYSQDRSVGSLPAAPSAPTAHDRFPVTLQKLKRHAMRGARTLTIERKK
jgi:hypothetical protein